MMHLYALQSLVAGKNKQRETQIKRFVWWGVKKPMFFKIKKNVFYKVCSMILL